MPNFYAILVPQGAEYQAVAAGLKQTGAPTPPVWAVPAGPAPLSRFLKTDDRIQELRQQPQARVLLLGLGGALTDDYRVGDGVLFRECLSPGTAPQPCDPIGIADLQQHLGAQVRQVCGLTHDRVITKAQEKRELAATWEAQVVDMEGMAALTILKDLGIGVTILRVVSDDVHHDLPDLSAAFDADGNLQPLPLALAFLKQPMGAVRLIRGSLKGLAKLRQIAACLFAA